MAQACCPPAPPKHASTCLEVSYPFAYMKLKKKQSIEIHVFGKERLR